jgi:hypothetical protein
MYRPILQWEQEWDTKWRLTANSMIRLFCAFTEPVHPGLLRGARHGIQTNFWEESQSTNLFRMFESQSVDQPASGFSPFLRLHPIFFGRSGRQWDSAIPSYGKPFTPLKMSALSLASSPYTGCNSSVISRSSFLPLLPFTFQRRFHCDPLSELFIAVFRHELLQEAMR